MPSTDRPTAGGGQRRGAASSWTRARLTRLARRVGRFLGISDLFTATESLADAVDAIRAQISTQQERILALEQQVERATMPPTAPLLPDGTPQNRKASAVRFRARRKQPLFQALWIGPRLSLIEQLSLTSFVANGHDVRLYLYEDTAGVPDGVECADAREILPQDRVFVHSANIEVKNAAGSYIAFSDLFRFKLLRDVGGWWFDLDVICLRPIDLESNLCLGWEQESVVGSSIIRSDANSRFASELYERASRRVTENDPVEFTEIGPRLITTVVRDLGLERAVLSAPTFYPVHWRYAGDMFESDDEGAWWSRFTGSYSVHLWNEILRWRQLDKDATFAPSSPIERLKRRYGMSAPNMDAT